MQDIIKPIPEPTPEPDALAVAVERIMSATTARAVSDANNWIQDFNEFWATVNGIGPAEKLAGLGNRAGRLFQLSGRRVAELIEALQYSRPDIVQAIMERLATLPSHTIHEDGTVTLNPPPADPQTIEEAILGVE
jgi:hypothetical protein